MENEPSNNVFTKQNQLKFKKKHNFTGFHPEGLFEQHFQFWMRLQNQTLWEIQRDVWKVRLRGFAPQTYFSHTNLKNSNTLISKFQSKFEILSIRVVELRFFLNFSWFSSVKMSFDGSFSNFHYFVETQQNRKFVFLINFRLKNLLFFHLTRNQ